MCDLAFIDGTKSVFAACVKVAADWEECPSSDDEQRSRAGGRLRGGRSGVRRGGWCYMMENRGFQCAANEVI